MLRDRTCLPAVVIVNFNTREHLRACLRTVVPERPERVVVADNGSSDGSAAMVRAEFPSVVLDVDASNPGYGAGANRGIRRCGSADVLLLNSDTRLTAGTLRGMAGYLALHPRAGLVGPRLRHPDGSLQPSAFAFPSLLRLPLERDVLAGLVRHVPLLRDRYLPTWSHDAPRVVPWVMGAALLIRRRAFDEVGGFDESFFMYAEEIDFCFRARQRRWETHLAPVADVIHEGAASTSQHRAAMLAVGCASIRHFYRRHYSGARRVLAESLIAVAMALRVARDAVRYGLATDPARRRLLGENLSIWRQALTGNLEPARPLGTGE
jgi:N-acetylglucosaminyl-diphospho-decaprenol L-rhamnosyltransferase